MNTTTSTRAELKARAKETLKDKYWYAFGFAILVSILIGIAQAISQIPSQLNPGNTGLLTLTAILGIAVSLFVVFPISVGSNRFFINIAKGNNPDVNDLLYVYKNGFMNTVLVLLLEGVYIFLWSLLFVIPGIIKTYQYMMIEYMLAENPNMSNKRAFEITKATMTGDKWKAFVLGLSFIGWILLSIITFGIGFLFLAPYVETTMAHYYLELKNKAVANGIVDAGELAD